MVKKLVGQSKSSQQTCYLSLSQNCMLNFFSAGGILSMSYSLF